MMNTFRSEPYPPNELIDYLTKRLELTERQVRAWYSNRRRKLHRYRIYPQGELRIDAMHVILHVIFAH